MSVLPPQMPLPLRNDADGNARRTNILQSRVSCQVADGVLQQIDLIDRQLTVRQHDSAITVAVPPNCEILLNGERVKLRLLQPRDRVRVAYALRDGVWAALSVEAKTRA
jgi:hypothetical protein